jgi:hypothetical protein
MELTGIVLRIVEREVSRKCMKNDGADRYCSRHCGEGSEPEVYETFLI